MRRARITVALILGRRLGVERGGGEQSYGNYGNGAHTQSPVPFRHAELVSASVAHSCNIAPWTLKQVQGDEWGMSTFP
jgi:hypothetical protein